MLYVMHCVQVMNRAGQETFIMNLFRKIDREQIQFDFMCCKPGQGDFDEEIQALGGRIYHPQLNRNPGMWKHMQNVFLLTKALKELDHPCDVFHIHTDHALDAFRCALAAKLAGVKKIAVHSHNTDNLYHLRAHKIFKKLLAKMDVCRFACAKEAGIWLFGESDFIVLHNGLDLARFHYDQAKRNVVREKMNWHDKKIVGHVGRFNEQKNHKFVIEVFRELHRQDPDTHLVLVGRGELEASIRDMVEKLHLSNAVSFLGVRDDVQELYQGMDLFFFPSLFEGLPVVLVEAQAVGLPCLITDTISTEALFTEQVIQKSLNDAPCVWAETAEKLLQLAPLREDTQSAVRNAGYDISDLAAHLIEMYTA